MPSGTGVRLGKHKAKFAEFFHQARHNHMLNHLAETVSEITDFFVRFLHLPGSFLLFPSYFPNNPGSFLLFPSYFLDNPVSFL